MRFVSIEIEGYRRFGARECLQVDSRLVALLGPNEAGKTSVLRALLALNDDSAFRADGASQDTTRGMMIDPNHPLITTKLLIEKDDLESLEGVEEAASLRWLIMRKHLNGRRTYSLEPPIRRSLAQRHAVLGKLDALSSQGSYETDFTNTEPDDPLSPDVDAVVDAIPDKDVETLPREAIEALRSLESTLKRAQCDELAEQISQLIEHETREEPSAIAKRILAKRVPRFVLFEDEDRNLSTTHDLSLAHREKNKVPISRALKNLAATAGLDLLELYNAAHKSDRGKVQTLLSSANSELKEKMSAAWSQSPARVSLDLNHTILTVLVGSDSTRWEILSERSDGLRQFVALFAFLSQTGAEGDNIVLLIDEAEAHLHYDAQADLIQMLGRQQLAKQVIYTTHSLGCLPEDLGLGLRFVQPLVDKDTSVIINKFWSEGSIGLSPILFGMGAATMAFLPVRYCILTEGPVDMLLLPVLLREATGRETLGYQVSPGLASCDAEQIALIQNDGSRVVFLVDGDAGGKGIEAKLKRAGVPEHRIFRLKGAEDEKCVIEDFVEKEVYVHAINEELQRSGRSASIKPSDLPGTLRPTGVEEWCLSRGVPTPKKVDVAYRILDQLYKVNLLDSHHTDALRQLDEKIVKRFREVANVERKLD